MLTKTKVNCEKCGKQFSGSHGVKIHQYRSNCGGETPQKSIKASKEEIQKILADYPKGLTTQRITAKLKEQGFQITALDYVAKTAGGDPNCIRITRGKYRLRKTPIRKPAQTQVITDVQIDHSNPEIHPQTLQLHIEMLEQNKRTLKETIKSQQEIIESLLKGL